jgi:hypothetical protein
MAIEVTDLVPYLKASVNPPGTDLFPDALTSDWETNLSNGFWEATLDGVITGYTETEGIIEPLDSDDDDLGRELQQLVVLYAAVTIVRNHLMNLKSSFRAKAGSVEYETGQSAQVLKSILDELIGRRTTILTALAEESTSSYYYDAAIARNESLYYGDTWWIGA